MVMINEYIFVNMHTLYIACINYNIDVIIFLLLKLQIILFPTNVYIIKHNNMAFILIFLLLVFLIVFVQNDVNITVNNCTFFIKIFFLYIIYFYKLSHSLQDSGVIPWKKGDFAITFCKYSR